MGFILLLIGECYVILSLTISMEGSQVKQYENRCTYVHLIQPQALIYALVSKQIPVEN